jgi:WD40 repeat protein
LGHLGPVICLASIDDQYLASGSCDKTIIIWNLNNYTIQTVIKQHSDCINVLSYWSSYKIILSGSSDKTINIWNSNTFEYMKTLTFTDAVLSLSYLNNVLSIGLKNNQILIYEKPYISLATLYGHSYWVYALLPNSNIVSGSFDATIKIWQSESYKAIYSTLGYPCNSLLFA